MQSGRQTLAAIDQGLQQVHDTVQEIDQRVKDSSAALMDLQRKKSGQFKRMAVIHLDNVISGELAAGLDVADQRVGELIKQRGQKLGAVNRQIKTNRQSQAALVEKRATASKNTERAAAELDKAEAATQSRLESDPQYSAQLDKTRKAERTAEHAREKTRQTESTREEKGKPYENDPLFAYLWRQQYGTSGYSAGHLTRLLDDWVARLCKYSAARANYASLLEIPKRLGEHAQHLHDLADKEFITLTKIEVREAAADGVPQLQESADTTQATLDAIDKEIEDTEDQLHALEQQRNRFTSGEDEDFTQAIDTLKTAFERENLQTLYEYARATATTEDDILVQEMDEARERVQQAAETLADRKRMRERQSERLQGLEDVRRRFKRNRFDNIHSEFRNDALLTMALSQFLNGTVTARELWLTIERGQRYRRIQSNPTFGSGGFRSRRGSWNSPFPGGGDLGSVLGGALGGALGGGRRRGGVRPGGGGGFRTGGGF